MTLRQLMRSILENGGSLKTFCVEKNPASGEVQVALTSWSRPGLWMVRVGSPLARRLQRTVNEGALVRLATVARAG